MASFKGPSAGAGVWRSGGQQGLVEPHDYKYRRFSLSQRSSAAVETDIRASQGFSISLSTANLHFAVKTLHLHVCSFSAKEWLATGVADCYLQRFGHQLGPSIALFGLAHLRLHSHLVCYANSRRSRCQPPLEYRHLVPTQRLKVNVAKILWLDI